MITNQKTKTVKIIYRKCYPFKIAVYRNENTMIFLFFLGTANRTVASTNMNATSSRAHTVVTIVFEQIITTDQGQTKKSSTMNLVDLAGLYFAVLFLTNLMVKFDAQRSQKY